MAWWKIAYWFADIKRNIKLWIKQRRPITVSDKNGLELLHVLYATNLSVINITEVTRIKDYYQSKYTSSRVESYFSVIAKKHSDTNAYRLSNLAWNHITINTKKEE